LAQLLHYNRKRIYYTPRQEHKDAHFKTQIEEVHEQHPAYGHRRVALALHCNKKRALRVMHKYHLKPPRRRVQGTYTTHSVYTNLIAQQKATKPGQILASDLTYIRYKQVFIYLATVEDLCTREILSGAPSLHHDSAIALQVVQEALDTLPCPPRIFHSDQGSEYMAQVVTGYLEERGVHISVSDKASPWQNGYKESFFSRLKAEVGDVNRFDDLGQLIAELYAYMHYHNTQRIHTALKMTPVQFKKQFVDRDSVSEKRGT